MNITNDQKDFRVVVVLEGVEKIGRCYNQSYWTVYSRWPLTEETLAKLIPHGQEFSVKTNAWVKEQACYVATIREATDSGD